MRVLTFEHENNFFFKLLIPSIKEAFKGFLLSIACLDDKILKNYATKYMDNSWISI